MTQFNTIIRQTDSEALGKLLSLMERDALRINDSQTEAPDTYSTRTSGTTALFNKQDAAVTLTRTRLYSTEIAEMEVSLGSLSLADLSEVLNLNPGYKALYALLEFSDVMLYTRASERDDYEYLTLQGTVLSEDEGLWDFLGIENMPLKELNLAVTVTHKKGSFLKNHRVTVTARLIIDGQNNDIEKQGIDVELSLPVGNRGLWSLKLLPPGLDFNIAGLTKLFMGDTFSHLPQPVQDIPGFTLSSLSINFDPAAARVHDISFGLHSDRPWNILPGGTDGSVLALQDIGLALTMRWDGNSNYSYQGQVNGTVHIGNFNIAAVIPIPLTGLMTLQVNSTKSLPSLGEFTQLLGGNEFALANYLPDGLSDSFSMDLNRLRLVIDLGNAENNHTKTLKEFELAIATPPKDPDAQDAPAWPLWPDHLEIDSFDLNVKLRHTDNSWQASGSINGRGIIEGTPLGIRIEKPEAGPWKITLTEPLVFSTGLSSISNLTGIDLETADNSVLPAGINDTGGFGIALRNFQLHLQDTAPTIPFLAVYIETQGTLEIISGLSLVQAAVIMEMQSPFVTEDRSITGQIGGEIEIGEHRISLVSSKNDEHTGWVFQGSSAPGDAISLSALLHTLLTGIGITLPGELPEVTVSDLELSYTPSEEHLTFKGTSGIAVTRSISAKFTVDLDYQSGVDPHTVFSGTGAIRIGNAVFYLTADYDSSSREGWAFTASTSDTIVLSELLREALADTPLALPAVLPLSLSVSDISFESSPKVHYYTLGGTADLELNISNFSLDLNMVLQALRPASPSPDAPPEKLQIDLEATANLLIAAGTPEEVALQLTGSYHSNGEGWLFTGSSAPGQNLPIGTLISDLATKFGITASPPQPLSTLSFKDLATSFNTQSKDFSFSGAMDFQVNNVDVDLKTQFRITHRQDGTSQKSFSGKLSLGTAQPKIFDLIFNSDATSTLMLAGYHSADGDTVSIADLAGSVLGISVPDVLSFTLKDAVLAYDADEVAKKVLLSAHMGNGLDLSRLPLVGKLFSEGAELTLNYQITAASGTFDAPAVAAINGLLPEGIGSLGDQAIAQGLGVSATMKISGDIVSFALPVKVNDDTTGTPDPVQLDPASPAAADDSMRWINLQKTFGPVHFNRIGIQYEDSTLTFVLDASFTVAGLTIGLDGLSVSSPLTKFAPIFDLKGLSIDFKNGALEVGASFLREHIGDPSPGGYDEYSGLAILKMKELSLSAIGSYAYVNGHPSLFIYAVLDYPLGGPSFFFVTGLSAGFGYNRALRMPTIDKVLEFPLVAEALNGKSLPANAGKEALVQELEAIHNYIPPSIGQFFVAAGLSFTTFKLIDSTVLVAVSFGNRFELDLLGVSTLTVPPEAPVTPLAVIQMTLKGAFIPDEGFAGLQGQLTPASYILSKDCHLAGGFAFYSWYKGDHAGDFVTTIGGYHPHFKVPAHYPKVPRLSFNWRLDSHAHIKGDMYFALCAHTLMAGAHLEATYEKGALKAWFKAGADFLVAWKPYHYEASAYVNIGCSYTFHFFGTHHINIDVSAHVDIWGPEFGGHAEVDLKICSIGVDIGAPRITTPVPVEWSEFNSDFLPQEGLCTVMATDGLVTKGPDDDHLGVVNPKMLRILTDAFIPSKTVQWGGEADDTGHIDATGTVISPRWTAGFGIGPMAVAANDLNCLQTITVEKHNEGDGSWSDHTAHFAYSIKTKKAPAGMWGAQLRPGVNDAQFIENTFSGLEIVPANAPTPGMSASIDRDFVQFNTCLVSDAIRWETREGFVASGSAEAALKTTINTSITANAAERDALLASLGIATDIDLTDSIADAYIMAPQVMETV